MIIEFFFIFLNYQHFQLFKFHSKEHELIIVGSSLNGLGTITSDVDMCLLLPKEAGEIDQFTQAIPILNFVKDHLEKQGITS